MCVVLATRNHLAVEELHGMLLLIVDSALLAMLYRECFGVGDVVAETAVCMKKNYVASRDGCALKMDA